MTKNTLIAALQTFGNISSDGMLLFDLKSKKIDYVNQALVKIFDISHDAFTHQAEFFMSHIVEDDMDHLRSRYETLLGEGKIENVEFSTKSHDGSIRSVPANCYVVENRKYIVGMFKDITFMREHENYIIDYGAKKNTLLDMVTHNLSGPLAISKNLLESLEKVVEAVNLPIVQEHIHLVQENTRHCIDIVNEFLEEEHLVSFNITVKKNRFELKSKVGALLERIKKSYPEFTFVTISNIGSLNVSQDDVKFLQVLNNLISNAVKWSPVNSTIEIRLEETHNTFTIAVADKGIGIPQHLQRFIFDRNSRASREGLRGEKSVGMGLYIVKRLVGIMGGDIRFASVEGRGSTFTLEFPKNDTMDGKEDTEQFLHRPDRIAQ